MAATETPNTSLTEAFRAEAQRQREALIVKAHELREGADHVRCLADQLEADAVEAEALLRRINLVLGLEPQLEIDDECELLRGKRLQEVAVSILREKAPEEPVHYQLWYRWLTVERGLSISGKDPLATFLASVSRHPAVERVGRRSGRYQLRAV